MRAYNIKLNPTKYAFGVSVKKFLGFMVTQRGIEVNPTQVKVVIETPTPNNKKELQHLIGRLPALSCFIAHFTNKLQFFFLILKGVSTFSWTDECKQTFEVVKRYLIEPPILSSPKSDEEFYMYLVVFDCATSAVLFRHIRDNE
ncbi:Retrovirus-related Pol polyprotein from transposon 412 [Vitis vinifera]|uniref:Retrovirus-related Pol polyprotein from transposon 412 n=1 Tax=Vitis vinifera TaxID=29760 RepID=A0A438EM83_VITVI|nr:Retrovirus-related Pol polyprotein from transposon 412 [Vitis vinifera]